MNPPTTTGGKNEPNIVFMRKSNICYVLVLVLFHVNLY